MPNKEDLEYTHMVMKGILDAIQDTINEELGEGFIITLLLHHENNPGLANYGSTGRREDMIKALKETALRLENNYDFPAGSDTTTPPSNN